MSKQEVEQALRAVRDAEARYDDAQASWIARPGTDSAKRLDSARRAMSIARALAATAVARGLGSAAVTSQHVDEDPERAMLEDRRDV